MQTWRGYRQRAAPSAQDRGSFRLNNVLGWLAIAGGLGAGLALRGASRFAIPHWLAWAGIPVAPSDDSNRDESTATVIGT